MLYWALMFLIVALVAALFGFGGIASTATGIAQILFVIAIVLFLVSLIPGMSPLVGVALAWALAVMVLGWRLAKSRGSWPATQAMRSAISIPIRRTFRCGAPSGQRGSPSSGDCTKTNCDAISASYWSAIVLAV